jgi:hypothetical protein
VDGQSVVHRKADEIHAGGDPAGAVAQQGNVFAARPEPGLRGRAGE